jgi:hypothetical protein
MGRNKNFNIAEELVKALHDERVRTIFGEIFDERVKALIEKVEFLDKENQRKTVEINQLKSELATATQKVNELESYNRRENLIITGLPSVNAAETVSAEEPDRGEHMEVTEKAVLELCHKQLGVPLTSADISIAHRLRKKPNASGPPAVIVRFTNRKAREAVYAARYQLKSCNPPVYINEDLTKTTAALFSQARKLVQDKRIYKTWTSGGHVYYRQSSQSGCKPVLITSATDLPAN